MEKMKIIFLEVLLLLGTIVLFYPDIADYINGLNQTRAVASHSKSLEKYDKDELKKIFQAADEYNKKLAAEKSPLYSSDKIEGYEQTLNPFNNGMMGYINIEKLNIELPIYHGMNEGVIQRSVGHLEGSSLPVGGESTHAVISTHSGLPSARLFTDLRKLEVGDEFTVSILDENLNYRIDQIVTVLPTEIEKLEIVEGKDYLTMFTCTPYGINSHRLLVRGSRIENDKEEVADIVEENKEKGIDTHKLKMLAILVVILLISLSIIWNIIKLIKKK